MALNQSSVDCACPNKLRDGFILLCENLLKAIGDVFPECDDTSYVLRIYETLVKGDAETEDKFIRKCQKVFKNHSSQMKARNPEAIFALCESVEVIKRLDMRSKWEDPDFTPESKENLWAYLTNLQTYSDLYTCVPSSTMTKIEGLAASVGDRMRPDGNLDLSGLDLSTFGSEVLGSMTQEEVSQLEANLPDIYACVGNVAGMLGHGTSSPDKGGAGIDLDGLLRTIAQMNTGGGSTGGEGGQDVGMGGIGELLKGVTQGAKLDPSKLMSVAQQLSQMQAGGGSAFGGNASESGGFDVGALMQAVSKVGGTGLGAGGTAAAHPNIFALEDASSDVHMERGESAPVAKKRKGSGQR